ncbi:S8 family serine peptidase [Clostridioides difficile]|uniref:S8 family serine peptidase n=1 Tax=Clostridioides difficile TaxID=1496 RepID=UPI00355B848D
MEKIKVAVVDTGIDVNDDSIKKYIKFNKNIQLEEVVEYKDLDDTHGHGTLCSKQFYQYVEILIGLKFIQ